MAASPSIDWGPVKTAYITSTKTTAELAVEFGVSKDAVEAQCTRGKWVAERRKLSELAEKRAADAMIARRLKQLDEMNDNDITLSKALKAHISLALQKAQVVDPATGAIKETTLTPREVTALASGLAHSQKVGRLAVGLSTENNAFAGSVTPSEPPTLENADGVTASKVYQDFITGGKNSAS